MTAVVWVVVGLLRTEGGRVKRDEILRPKSSLKARHFRDFPGTAEISEGGLCVLVGL